MPTLKQLECHIELTGALKDHLQEYGTCYDDGVVNTFVAVPTKPSGFCIKLSSEGYISDGLGVFVFIDGEYQCNRVRTGLLPPSHAVRREETEVAFTLRQKETLNPNSTGFEKGFIVRDWKFDKLNIGFPNASKATLPPMDALGTIVVLVLRCSSIQGTFQRSEVPDNPTNPHVSVKKSPRTAAKPSLKSAPSKTKRATTAESTRNRGEESVVGLGGLFDGPAEYSHCDDGWNGWDHHNCGGYNPQDHHRRNYRHDFGDYRWNLHDVRSRPHFERDLHVPRLSQGTLYTNVLNPYGGHNMFYAGSRPYDRDQRDQFPGFLHHLNVANTVVPNSPPPSLSSLDLGIGHGRYEKHDRQRSFYHDGGDEWLNSKKNKAEWETRLDSGEREHFGNHNYGDAKDSNYFGGWEKYEHNQSKVSKAWDVDSGDSSPKDQRAFSRHRIGSHQWPSPNIQGLQYRWNAGQNFEEAERTKHGNDSTWDSDWKTSSCDRNQISDKGPRENNRSNSTADANGANGGTNNPWDVEPGKDDWETSKHDHSWTDNQNATGWEEENSRKSCQEWETSNFDKNQWERDDGDEEDQENNAWNSREHGESVLYKDDEDVGDDQNNAAGGDDNWRNDNAGQDQQQNDGFNMDSNNSQQNHDWADNNDKGHTGKSGAKTDTNSQFTGYRSCSCDGSGARRKERLSRPYLGYPSFSKDCLRNVPSHLSRARDKAPNDRVKLDKSDGPLYSLPEEVARDRGLDYQVRGGPEFEYYHRTCRESPNYIDTIEKPYATFVFHYRSKRALETILRVPLKESDEEYKSRMESLSKEKIIEELLKLKAKQATPDDAASVASSASKVRSSASQLVDREETNKDSAPQSYDTGGKGNKKNGGKESWSWDANAGGNVNNGDWNAQTVNNEGSHKLGKWD